MPKRKDIHTILIIGSALVALLGGSESAFAQTPPVAKVDRLCGYLQRETQTSRDSVFKTKVSLYRRSANVECCNIQDQLIEVLTKGDGKFEFKHIAPGTFWVVATFENHEYKMAVEFSPVKNAAECAENLYTIENNGNFVLKTYVD